MVEYFNIMWMRKGDAARTPCGLFIWFRIPRSIFWSLGTK